MEPAYTLHLRTILGNSPTGVPLGWSNDGKEILILREESGIISIEIEDTAEDLLIGPPVVLFDASRYQNFSMTPDAQTIYATRRSLEDESGTITFISNWMQATTTRGR